MTFNDSIHKHNLKYKPTSNTKIHQLLSALSLNDVVVYLRNGLLSSDIGIVNLHPTEGTHWVCYINENYFDSYGCSIPNKLYNFNIKRNGHCLYSEYKIQSLTSKQDSCCASYCLSIIYSKKVLGIDFISVVLNLYYQRSS